MNGFDRDVCLPADEILVFPQRGWSALAYAAFNGNLQIVKHLLRAGAEDTLRPPPIPHDKVTSERCSAHAAEFLTAVYVSVDSPFVYV